MMELIPKTFAEGLAALERGDEFSRVGEVLQAVAIATICDRYEVDEERAFETIERLMQFGADGTASVGEFVALEVAGVLGVSPGSAIGRIADVLNVRDRHPVLWEAVLAGRVRFFQAASVASECQQLSAEQAAQIDTKCAQALVQWPWARVLKELPRWIIGADPSGAKAREVLARKERKVHVTDIKDGQVEVFARLSPADGIAFDTAIAGIAAKLPKQELPSDVLELGLNEEQERRVALNARRAAAMGELARSAFGQDALPVQLVITIDASQVPAEGGEASGAAHVERWGDLLASRLPEFLAGSKVIVRPVIDPSTLPFMDSHDPSADMRLALNVRDRYCVGPFGATRARSCDADHTVPYVPGEKGQTHLAQLGNLSRFVHRAKTAGKVQATQVRPGVFHWRYRSGFEFLVTAAGTVRLTPPAPPAARLVEPPVKPYADPPLDNPAWDLLPDRPSWIDTELLLGA